MEQSMSVPEAVVMVMPRDYASLRRDEIIRMVLTLLPHRSRYTVITAITDLSLGPHRKLQRIGLGIYRRRAPHDR